MKIVQHFISLIILNTCCINYSFAQNLKSEVFLTDSIFKNGSSLFKKVILGADTYKLQIIYTQIDRDKNDKPFYHTYRFHVDSSNYFYPASLVKLPLSALALEKISSLKINGVHKFTKIVYDSAFSCQISLKTYKKSIEGYPSIGDFIRRMLLVSDNIAYSRVFEYCGQEYLHRRLSEMGFHRVRITHRFDPGCDTLENRYTNPIGFYDEKGVLLYKQEMQYSSEILRNPMGKVSVGKANIINEKLIKTGRDFTNSNYLPLNDVHIMIQSLIFPQSAAEPYKFKLSEDDFSFIRKYMRMYPRQSAYEEYRSGSGYFDAYKKYLFYGRSEEIEGNENFRIYNVVGMSYGFLADCAYFADLKNNVDFFLSAVIYTNKSEVINSGNYEYKSIGLPFLKELGELIYNYEIKRKKVQQPDLSKLLNESY